jgi:hypothetical protein
MKRMFSGTCRSFARCQPAYPDLHHDTRVGKVFCHLCQEEIHHRRFSRGQDQAGHESLLPEPRLHSWSKTRAPPVEELWAVHRAVPKHVSGY